MSGTAYWIVPEVAKRTKSYTTRIHKYAQEPKRQTWAKKKEKTKNTCVQKKSPSVSESSRHAISSGPSSKRLCMDKDSYWLKFLSGTRVRMCNGCGNTIRVPPEVPPPPQYCARSHRIPVFQEQRGLALCMHVAYIRREFDLVI